VRGVRWMVVVVGVVAAKKSTGGLSWIAAPQTTATATATVTGVYEDEHDCVYYVGGGGCQTPSHVSNRFLGHGASVHKTAG
jgi:hypothetical protein